MNAAVSVVADQLKRQGHACAIVIILALGLPSAAAFAQQATPSPVPTAGAVTAPAALPSPGPPPTPTPTPTSTPKPNFEFVDGTAATLAPDAKVQFKFDVLIKNSGDLKGVPSLELVSDVEERCGPNNLALVPAKLETIQPKGGTLTHVTVSGVKLPATCYLRLTAGDPAGNTSLKPLKLSQEYLTKDVTWPLYVCLGVSGFIAFGTWMVACARLGWLCIDYRIGSPAWELDKSWISNATVVSSVIATAMALGALPELTRYASKAGYAALTLLISLVVIAAPFLFTAFRLGKLKEDDKKETVVYDGCLATFLLSGALTLFAGMAQVVVLFLLFDEIFLGYGYWSFGSVRQPWSSLNIGSLSTGALGIALCFYVAHSMYMTIKLQTNADVKAGLRTPKKPKTKATTDTIAPEPTTPRSPGLSWPVL